MKTTYMDLNKILNVAKWQTLQDSLASVSKMAIITVDYKGIPITTHSHPCRFCQFVRSQPELQQYCFKCDSRGGLEAVRLNAPYIYLCHCGIVDFAVPIMIEGKYVGAIMMGEVRLPKNEENHLEKILQSPTRQIFAQDGVLELYNEIPITSIDKVRQFSSLVFDLSNYIVEEAITKNVILDIYGEIANLNHSNSGKDIASYLLPNDIQHVKKVIGNAITNAYAKSEIRVVCKNPVLRPAFDYIYDNKGEDVTLRQMADICHISTGHFSRMFTKEVGEGFSNFLSRLKVQWSKQLLEKTDLSITQISEELGFNDSGYFIKTFKKYENVTPAVYRRYYFESGTTE